MVFSMGLIAMAETALRINSAPLIISSSIVISYLVNLAIDALGHERRGAYVARSPRTHTVGRSMIIGLALSIPVAAFFYYMTPIGFSYSFAVALMGPISGLSHMFLDSLTEHGVFIRRGGKWVRFAILRARYNNAVLNGLFTVLGLLMLLYSILITLHV